MIQTSVFDSIYYLLVAGLTIVLSCAAVLSFSTKYSRTDSGDRSLALGVCLAAVGLTIALVGSVALTALSRGGGFWDSVDGGLFYQRATFTASYVGMGIVLYGTHSITISRPKSLFFPTLTARQIEILLWGAFLLSVAFSSISLFNSASYLITKSGSIYHVAQQKVFWLPIFVTLVLSVTISLSIALNSKERNPHRRGLIWFGLAIVFVQIGLLRESLILPSSGDPLEDLLIVFIPSSIGGILLLQSARVFSSIERRKGEEKDETKIQSVD